MSDIYLCFHGLGTPPLRANESERRCWLPREQFIDIVKLAYRSERTNRRIYFTFDDGNKSDIAIAWPTLRDFGFQAYFFVISNWIGEQGFLDASDIRTLRSAGMIFGSHGIDHTSWTTLSDADLLAQVSSSMSALSQILGEPINSVAPPFGAHNRRVLRILKELGVGEIFTTTGGATRSCAWVKARNTIFVDTPWDEIEMLLSGKTPTSVRFRNTLRYLKYRLI